MTTEPTTAALNAAATATTARTLQRLAQKMDIDLDALAYTPELLLEGDSAALAVKLDLYRLRLEVVDRLETLRRESLSVSETYNDPDVGGL